MGLKQKIIAQKLEQELGIKKGMVNVDHSSCDGCKTCLEICPHKAIERIHLNDEQVKALPFKGRLKVRIKGREKALINQNVCTACGLCMKECHEFAIHKTAIQL